MSKELVSASGRLHTGPRQRLPQRPRGWASVSALLSASLWVQGLETVTGCRRTWVKDFALSPLALGPVPGPLALGRRP